MPESEPQNLRVLVADERQKYVETIGEAVKDLGHDVIAHEVEIAKVGRATGESRPDIAIGAGGAAWRLRLSRLHQRD
jgi:hypothetical protein